MKQFSIFEGNFRIKVNPAYKDISRRSCVQTVFSNEENKVCVGVPIISSVSTSGSVFVICLNKI